MQVVLCEKAERGRVARQVPAPEADRVAAVAKELEAFGVKVVAQYATLGAFDFVNILEAPDNLTIARVSAELASRGSVRIQTLPAVPVAEFIAKFKK